METPQVFCDLHLQPMKLAELTFAIDSSDQWRSHFFRCNVPGCIRYFNLRHGYVDIDCQIKGTTRNRRGCENHHEHGSMAIIAVVSGEPIWGCIYKGCSRKVDEAL